MVNLERTREEDSAYDRATTILWQHATAAQEWGFVIGLLVVVGALIALL